MRIYDTGQQANSITTGSAQQGNRTDGTSRSQGASSGRNGRSDEVQLSVLGSYLAEEAGSPEREARVAGLAVVYRSGGYSVSSEAVSARIIDDATHTQ